MVQKKLNNSDAAPEELAAMLKERVYVASTALAVLIATGSHGHTPTAGAAALTLVVTVAAVLMASLVADIIAHSTVHAAFVTRAEFRHLLKVVWGAGGAVFGPLALLGLSALDVLDVSMALRLGQWWLIAALAFFAFLAMRRMNLGFLRTTLLMLLLATAGVVVILLQLLAHS
ncbi:hypothetical protein [Glutamicibacter mishrai]|uniref:Uncharacterized protein n=1 Tax=Glutamicibacter mishrai TaxID=1775880 RepID=A0A6H0SIQ9_9MICC|nr:hypothetical protein [Glutamicibacter mishrai]QIV87060.1 hypothetical protein D3791_07925 [Glutamicibacter mishrai]